MLWPTELPRQDCWAGLGGGPRSRTTGLEGQRAACLRHSQVFADGPGGTTRTCTSFDKARPLLRRLRLPISPRPDGSDFRSRRRESNARPLTYQVSALAISELRRLEEKCRRQDSNLQCAEARHVLGVVRLPVSPRRQRVARVGFQPTVSWMKARHVGALHQRAPLTGAPARS